MRHPFQLPPPGRERLRTVRPDCPLQSAYNRISSLLEWVEIVKPEGTPARHEFMPMVLDPPAHLHDAEFGLCRDDTALQMPLILDHLVRADPSCREGQVNGLRQKVQP